MKARCHAAVLAAACAAGACRGARSVPVTQRLADLYTPANVEGRVAPEAPAPRTEWRFDGPAPSPTPARAPATRGWDAINGVADLGIRDGRLAGRTTDDLPLLHYERTTGVDDGDLVQEVQVRLRASAGANLTLGFEGSEKLDVAQVIDGARSFPPPFKSPIVAGPEMRTYTLKTPFSAPASRFRHVLVRPTDAKGATFEVESVRLVLRREFLASVPSGVGWQGLAEVYKETIVARAPEVVRLKVTLPERPWLDMALGTVENGPVGFHVGLRAAGAKDETTLVDRTVTRAYRWENAPLDLARYAGQEVELALRVTADRPGTLGFWGSPAIRSHGALPAPATSARALVERPQGVILIWADTLRRDHLSVYGYQRPTTPTLERLAKDGVLFRDCIGQASWTKVATPSLLTSLYPTSHGVHDFADRLPSSATTLAEAYRAAGYATLSFSSILFTGKLTNLHQGFEEVHEDGSLPDPNSSKTAREYVDRLLPWLEVHRDTPFFVFLHVSDPHDPYKPYPPYDTSWADAKKADEHEKHAKDVRKSISDPLLRAFGMPTRDELKKAGIDAAAYVAQDEGWYDGSIRAMDAEIARLVERLRSLGLEDRTLVVFTSDHGEEFLDHGRTFHGQSVYGEMNNMSLILYGPGIVPRGRTVDATVQTIDVMPTLLETSRVVVPAEAQGRSLLPLLAPGIGGADTVRADAADARPAISEKAATDSVGGPPPRDTASVAIVSGTWKLIHNTKRAAGRAEFELFDHRADPLDQKDVAADHPDVVARLARDLAAWQAKAEAARLKPDGEATQGLSREELERLRSLGYIQ